MREISIFTLALEVIENETIGKIFTYFILFKNVLLKSDRDFREIFKTLSRIPGNMLTLKKY